MRIWRDVGEAFFAALWTQRNRDFDRIWPLYEIDCATGEVRLVESA